MLLRQVELIYMVLMVILLLTMKRSDSIDEKKLSIVN